MTPLFVSSMSLAGYEQYGKAFLESFKKHVSYHLCLFSEDKLPVRHFDLTTDLELMTFLKDAPDGPDYRYQAGRFAKKIFSVTSVHLPSSDWRIWIDADTLFHADVTPEFLSEVCPEGMIGSYLGRKDMGHSECGWVAYNMRYAQDFLRDFRNLYVSGEIYDHLEWHDSYLFDRVREQYRTRQGLDGWYNLSKNVPGMHVWDESPLGKVAKHLKGPLRKSGKTADVPKEYWSKDEIQSATADHREA